MGQQKVPKKNGTRLFEARFKDKWLVYWLIRIRNYTNELHKTYKKNI